MPLSRRYTPEFPVGESSIVGMDYSYVIPPGVGIADGTLALFNNDAIGTPVTSIDVGPVSWIGRTLYARLTLPVTETEASGVDIQLRWTATDTEGNIWPRTALLLVAPTS